jgi:hypothetical protein
MKISRGTIREDGMIFWKRKNNKEIWLTPEKFEKEKNQYKEYIKTKWYPKNKAKVIQRVNQWRSDNRERRNKYCLEWARKNYQKLCISRKTWRLNNPEKIKESQKKHYILHPENRMKKLALRRCREKNQAPELTENQKKIIDCLFMQAIRLGKIFGTKFDIDHIIPIAKGGLHIPSNLQILPAKINKAKGSRHIFRWQDYASPSSLLP